MKGGVGDGDLPIRVLIGRSSSVRYRLHRRPHGGYRVHGRIVLVGGSGFIGSNLALALSKDSTKSVLIAGRKPGAASLLGKLPQVGFHRIEFGPATDYTSLFQRDDVVVHLVSSTTPGTSNAAISGELDDIVSAARMLDACVAAGVSKVVYVSSGGAVYGATNGKSKEDDSLDPISTYGLQKAAIEKLLGIYGHQHGLDYRIVRPSNPYGPWQNPKKGQGIVGVFVHNALVGEPLVLYGKGDTVRDFVYIDDLVEGMQRVLNYEGEHRVFNLGSGEGLPMNRIAKEIRLQIPGTTIAYAEGRSADVPLNVLDMTLFEGEMGPIPRTEIGHGVKKVIAHQRALLDAGVL